MSLQSGWEAQLYNSELPYWMRVYAVAMGRSEPNLHTLLEPGELAKLLGHKQADGSIEPLDRRDLHRYVKRAVDLQLLDEAAKTNVNGGAIAIGHPLGASGARIMTTLVNALEQRGGRYGLQTMCEGGGMANATIIERLT
jgi:acetyl-CoA acetyltransferase